MMGWADKLVNPFLRLAPGGPWSPVWLYVFVAWLVSPVFLTDPKVSRRFLGAWRALCLRCAPEAARGACHTPRQRRPPWLTRLFGLVAVA